MERSERQQPPLDADQRGQADPDQSMVMAERSSGSTASTICWLCPVRSPALQPFSVGVVYRMRDRGDFTGVMSAVPPAGDRSHRFLDLPHASAGSFAVRAVRPFCRAQRVAPPADDSGAMGRSRCGRRRAEGSRCATSWDEHRHLRRQLRHAGRESCSAAGTAGAPFGYAAIDVLATVGASRALSTTDQQRLIEWASARWSL